MKTFKQYCEGQLQQQEDLATKAITRLYYSGVAPDAVTQLSLEDISRLLNQYQLNDPSITPMRFAAMVKLKARLIGSEQELSPVAPKGDQ